ncbi:ArsR/SmtB family transcription factor [Pseudonocardia sp.]|uniref:ArsR/SmtB family transcription factor n=1 Tax=Pseudonocardia sp. TaxID=60912 RepID=UPI003D14ECBE
MSMDAAVALFRSLGDATRLAILKRLAEGEARVVDLSRLLELPQSTVSSHLACLRGCRIVDYRTQGRQSFYSLTRPELVDLLRSAEHLLAETGDTVALRPAHTTPAAAT